ncbi:MAG: hypothetical protein R3266_09395, partial [Gemmatimonadota bacterium]|nr:hypothetical protein [Gemmatimonadota bacterium]
MLNRVLRPTRATLFGLGLLALSTGAGAQPTADANGTACDTADLAEVADRLATAFDTHSFVFLGSTHGGVKRHDFLLCLLSRPAFLDAATDIVVEFASGAHQGLLDRYLIELESLSPADLRPLALDTDRPELFATLPQVPAFLEAARRVNEGLPRPDRIRVLGGNETIRWSAVGTPGDLAPFPFKTNWTAHLIIEHLASDTERGVLVVYGDGHIKRGSGTLMSSLEAELDPDRLFV